MACRDYSTRLKLVRVLSAATEMAAHPDADPREIAGRLRSALIVLSEVAHSEDAGKWTPVASGCEHASAILFDEALW